MSTPAGRKAAHHSVEEADSPLLCIPPELRLAIYESALFDSPCVTVGHAEVVGQHHDVIHHLYGEDRTPYPGLPQNHIPLIAPTYDSSLLSTTNPATILATSSSRDSIKNYSTHQSLLLVNHQIHDELVSHLKLLKNRQTSVFASYPYGLHILKTTASQLLGQAQSLHLAGQYEPSSFSSTRAANDPSREKEAPTHNASSAALLGQLVASMFGRDPIYNIRKLEMRIYYPGEGSYSTVWGDEDSPTVVALRNILNAEVGIEVWRGPKGTGIYLTVRRARENKRIVSTVWRRLNMGGRGQPEVGSWIVDPKWPRWDEEYEKSEGPEGNVFTSVPVGSASAGGASAS